MNVGIIGAGGWGTAISILLARKFPKRKISIWNTQDYILKIIESKRENLPFLKGIKIPANVIPVHSLRELVRNKEFLILAVPSLYFRRTVTRFKSFIQPKRELFILSLTKGIEKKTNLRMTQILEKELGNRFKKNIGVLSGPSHAEEVSRNIPTAVVIASQNEVLANKIQKFLHTNTFRTYTNKDIIGVELGGALKNVIAIAAGIVEGLKLGDNTKAALITRGLAEITRFGIKLGARHDTFLGLAGIGDLMVTCYSKFSRNRAVGEKIAKGNKLSNIIKGMNQVAEGVETARNVYRYSKELGVDMPITTEVYKILYRNKNVKKSILELMTRSLKKEHYA